MAKKIYLSPERRPAPHGPYFGQPGCYEHDMTTRIAELTVDALTRCGFAAKLAQPAATLRQRVAEAILWGADYYLPIHTNASTATLQEGTARGPEVLAYGSPEGVSWRACQMTYEALMEIYPGKTDRGVRSNTTFYEINSTPMLSVYPELAFHDNAADAAWLVENKSAIAEALAKAVNRLRMGRSRAAAAFAAAAKPPMGARRRSRRSGAPDPAPAESRRQGWCRAPRRAVLRTVTGFARCGGAAAAPAGRR